MESPFDFDSMILTIHSVNELCSIGITIILNDIHLLVYLFKKNSKLTKSFYNNFK